jgi:alkanesulfonate monooxygenase SsuD/methylene tetrahydromethanopterin reductase-like flavin-dependent oxidoreductase (luciferase family)
MPLRMSVLNVGRYAPERLRSLAQLQEDCGYETFWYADSGSFVKCTPASHWWPCTRATCRSAPWSLIPIAAIWR